MMFFKNLLWIFGISWLVGLSIILVKKLHLTKILFFLTKHLTENKNFVSKDKQRIKFSIKNKKQF
jgi:hypothetical protein